MHKKRYALKTILRVLLLFVAMGVYWAINMARAKRSGFIIPDYFMVNQTTEMNGFRSLIDPYPKIDWAEGYTIGAYQSLDTPLLEWTGKPCKIYGDFCSGTDVDSVFSVVLLNSKKEAVAAFTLQANLICAKRRKHFTREQPIVCENAR